MSTPDTFITRWRRPLEGSAKIVFEREDRLQAGGNHCQIADALTAARGFKPIGFNWEMLDPLGGFDEPRSALAVMSGAFSKHMEFPQQQWLGDEQAIACATEFIELFESESRTIVSNRILDFWNPLTDAKIEWAFVGFDNQKIALLLATI